ncbi:PIN domain-containing protein [candidate division KSB1 bacterium]|nr:PIN domain-containing protein [candidate division KSB1 bacterium]
MIYLDTHVVAWLYAGEINKLSELVKALINDNELVISPVVRLELQYLHEIQRISDTATTILSDLSDRIGLTICDINFNTIINHALDNSWTRDPFDRIIVANAAVRHTTLVTKDQTILANYKQAMW